MVELLFLGGSSVREGFKPVFQSQPSPEPKPSGPHTRESGNPTRGRPWYLFFPFLPLRDTVSSCHHRSYLFRRVCKMSGAYLSSFHGAAPHFLYFGSSTQFHPLEQGSACPQGIGRVLGHLFPYLGTGLFLLVYLKLNFYSQNLNSVTFGPIFPFFTSGLPLV